MSVPLLLRPRDGRVIAGVSGVLANRLGVSVTFVRLAFLVTGLLTAVGIVVYVVLWIVVPSER